MIRDCTAKNARCHKLLLNQRAMLFTCAPLEEVKGERFIPHILDWRRG